MNGGTGPLRAGGQALADGVLMRTERAWAIARIDGTIETRAAARQPVRPPCRCSGSWPASAGPSSSASSRACCARARAAMPGCAGSRRANRRFLLALLGAEAVVARSRAVAAGASTSRSGAPAWLTLAAVDRRARRHAPGDRPVALALPRRRAQGRRRPRAVASIWPTPTPCSPAPACTTGAAPTSSSCSRCSAWPWRRCRRRCRCRCSSWPSAPPSSSCRWPPGGPGFVGSRAAAEWRTHAAADRHHGRAHPRRAGRRLPGPRRRARRPTPASRRPSRADERGPRRRLTAGRSGW